MQQIKRKGRHISKIWVLIVLIIGVVLGIVLSAAQSTTSTPWRPGGHGHGNFAIQIETADDFDVILSTVGIVLLAALVFVYVMIYGETKAKFTLGLVAVFFALLFQSMLMSPLVYGALGQASGGLGAFLLLADLFKIGAFTVLLYLSLD